MSRRKGRKPPKNPKLEAHLRAVEHERKARMNQQPKAQAQRVAEVRVHLCDGQELEFTNVLYMIDATPAAVLLQIMEPNEHNKATVFPMDSVLFFEMVPPAVSVAQPGDVPPVGPEGQ